MRIQYLHAPSRVLAQAPAGAGGGGGGSFDPIGNKPAAYSVMVIDYGFNDQIPSGGDTIIGSGPLHQVFNEPISGSGLDAGRARRTTDSTAPEDGPYVLEQFIPAGSGTPTDSTGAGLIYSILSGETRGYYMQMSFWLDPLHEFNNTSYKLMNVWNASGSGPFIPLTVQFAGNDTYPPTLNDGGDVFAVEDESFAGVPYYPMNQPAASKVTLNYLRGHWVNFELLYEMGTGTSGRFRIWVGRSDGSDPGAGALKGELVSDYSGIAISVGCSGIDPCNMTWGGGNGPTKRDIYRRTAKFRLYKQP